MTFKEIFVNCKFQYIEAIEQELLDEGLARMSTYFGEYHVYENGMPAKHLFWDHDEYYYFICLNPESKERVMVWCSDCLGTEYELLDEFSADLSGMELKQRIKKIIDVWKPKQERILKKSCSKRERKALFLSFSPKRERRIFVCNSWIDKSLIKRAKLAVIKA